jgi:outer membrane protein OmpA-like peptidoglycan-associated protein
MNMLCQDHFGSKSYDKLEGMQILHNSQVAAVGIYTPSQSQESDMWILKLNEDCTIAPLATTTTSFYEELLHTFAKEIQQNLLVIHKNLSIELTDKNLYFAVGAYELTKEQKSFLDSFSNKLFTLMQKYQHAIESFSINGHTSSEWGNAPFTQRYLKNERLSMNRAYSTLSYMFETQTQERQMFLSQIFKGIGQNYRKRVLLDEKEDKELSRRVSFEITLH